ncbi:two-component system sensor histidine kinase NtrB [Rhodopirellula bahusiensis]|uniref:histidine kinase n=1 Tax=Rhodopirellula bahusiensis TaxID=2014065 RepID=A0A2G1WA13_9BACT|nr:ATP-binding protein [Rhodopirellula bahusiensis]PHQ35868.1 PAS domain-containing sensor histidine kinase [Rhodopirellula bahusiensis]
MTQRHDLPAQVLPRRGQSIPPEFFRAIAESTVDWESWQSANGQVVWVNQAVERFTGYTPKECLAMDDYPLPMIAAEDRERMGRHLEEASKGSTGNNVEFKVLHRDQSTSWVAVSWQPMTDREGNSLGFRASFRDVTERRQMREQLREQNAELEHLVQMRTAKIAQLEKHRLKMEKLAALGELAAGVAHEINNPLAGIRNAFALLKRHLPSNVKHYDKLDLIDGEIERIRGITHQMFQLYRPSQQLAVIFDIRRCLDELISLAMPMSRKCKVEVQLRCEPLPATNELEMNQVLLREGELKQILLNLIHNAIQASAAEQTVRLDVRADGDRLVVRVNDHGCGIEADVIGAIFDPFFSTKTTTVGQGMGLGLSVTRGLVEAMQGTIEVTSQPNEGTTFCVQLPRLLKTEPEAK